ncbi:hypothetical protein RhiirA4_542255 [Rhizophagus irregularis]|uniref:EF-hand domain-containing protein n=1 Tax=Rhizophagus irregularis TaxID=588596 RepID=A0A2I1GEG2_9GLOM|nr:hypothetical protein RhiirA4_542255 [Rhizophagus irregularis]
MSSSNNTRNSLSLFYEKSLKKVSGVYIQTKQNSIKLLSTLNINIANKCNEVEPKSSNNSNNNNNNSNNNLENCNKYVKSRSPFFNPPTPYQIDNFISDVPTPYCNLMNQDYYFNNDDNEVSNPSNTHSMNGPLYKDYSYGLPFTQKSPQSINEKEFSDQDSSDDQDDYFSRKISNYSSQSSSSSVSTNYGVNEFALTPLTNDEGCEIIKEEINHTDVGKEKEKSKEKNIKRRKSTMKSITSQKSDKSFKSNKSISKLSLKLSKNKSSSSSSTVADTVGTINFEEFISSLDISEDVEGRLQWLFRFYDNDGDGFITRSEMLQIMHTLNQNLLLTRKQVENYGQSSITFNSIQIVELPITELRMPIKHSPLTTYSELPDKLIKYIDKARIFDKDLQILQTRTKSSLDKLITYLCALKISVNHNKANTNDAYYQTTTFIETELREMMLVFQYARRSLADLDEISVELHDLTTYELTRYKREYNKLLDSFWSKLGGNSRKIQEYEENLTLLKDLDKRLRMALSHIGTTSRNLESFLLNLDELRKLVSVTEMPIKIHIEIVWKGVVRLISEGGVGDVSLIGILINSIESSWSKTSVPTLIKFILSV